MKKNLLKILATMAIVVTLGACGKPNPKPSESSSPESSESEGEKTLELDLDGLQVIDDEPDESGYFPFTNAGRLVKISDLCLCEQLDSKTYIVNWNGDTTGGDEMGAFDSICHEHTVSYALASVLPEIAFHTRCGM